MGCFGLGFGLYVGLSFDDIFDCAWLCFGSGFLYVAEIFWINARLSFGLSFWLGCFGLVFLV